MPWAGFVKPIYIMEQQVLLNQIATLASTIDPLIRAEQKDAAKEVAEKILELVKNIK